MTGIAALFSFLLTLYIVALPKHQVYTSQNLSLDKFAAYCSQVKNNVTSRSVSVESRILLAFNTLNATLNSVI